MQVQRGSPAGFQPSCKLATHNEWQKPLGRPKSNGRRSGSGTFQADLAKMQVARREVGVGRVVYVEAAHGRIAEQYAAASIGLETVFVGINHNGIDDR